jgi:hypothetical protein
MPGEPLDVHVLQSVEVVVDERLSAGSRGATVEERAGDCPAAMSGATLGQRDVERCGLLRVVDGRLSRIVRLIPGDNESAWAVAGPNHLADAGNAAYFVNNRSVDVGAGTAQDLLGVKIATPSN